MDNFRYIDLNTFEISESPKGFIPCDKEIADIIAILNKKGYKTVASCAGHNTIQYGVEEEIWPIDDIDSLKERVDFKILSFDDNNVYGKAEHISESTYIVFDKNYDFDEIPVGFDYDDKYKCLLKMIDYYDDEITSRRRDIEIENELENNWFVLREWANKLKYYKEKENDKYE